MPEYRTPWQDLNRSLIKHEHRYVLRFIDSTCVKWEDQCLHVLQGIHTSQNPSQDATVFRLMLWCVYSPEQVHIHVNVHVGGRALELPHAAPRLLRWHDGLPSPRHHKWSLQRCTAGLQGLHCEDVRPLPLFSAKMTPNSVVLGKQWQNSGHYCETRNIPSLQ